MKAVLLLLTFLATSFVATSVSASCTRPTIEFRPIGRMGNSIGRLCPIHVYVPEGEFAYPSFDINDIRIEANSKQLNATPEIVGARTADYISYSYDEDCNMIDQVTEVSYTEYVLRLDDPLPATAMVEFRPIMASAPIYTSADLNEEGCEQPYSDPMDHRCYPPIPNPCDSLGGSSIDKKDASTTDFKDASITSLNDAGLSGKSPEADIPSESTGSEMTEESEDVSEAGSEYYEEDTTRGTWKSDKRNSKSSGCQLGHGPNASPIVLLLMLLVWLAARTNKPAI